MNEIDVKILSLINQHTRLSVPQIIDILYPNAPEWDRSSLRSKIYGKCRNLMLYHYLRRVEVGNVIMWEVME